MPAPRLTPITTHSPAPLRRASLRSLIAAALLTAVVGCGEDTPPPPNILLITMDTTRADHCSVVGYHRDTTPNLEAFAAQGTSFNYAYSPTSTTGPTHASIFTAMYPAAHRVVKNGLTLAEDLPVIAEHLQAEGYQTAAVISSFVLNRKFGYAQGFETYDDEMIIEESTLRVRQWEGHAMDSAFDRRADHTTSHALKWLTIQSDRDRPFFLWVHYFDPHVPYDPPPKFLAKFAQPSSDGDAVKIMIDKYNAEIAFTDEQIGRLLQGLEQMQINENTIVIITADHGEGMMDHGYSDHGNDVYEEAVRVPLLFRWPGHIPAGRVIDAPVGIIDLAPTVCELIGADLDPDAIQSTSLANVLRDPDRSDLGRPVYLYRRHHDNKTTDVGTLNGELFGVRLGDWKYIRGEQQFVTELFNLVDDPNERHNVYTQFPEEASALAKLVEDWKAASASGRQIQENLTSEDIARLKSMGYVK